MHVGRSGKMLMKDRVSVMVVYASQQGNAQAIAEDLRDELEEHLKDKDITLRLECISKLGNDPSMLSKSDCAVFIAATTGDGDPPDTAKKIWRVLNKSKPARGRNCDSNDSSANPRRIVDGSKTHDIKDLSSNSSKNVADFQSKVKDSDEKVNDSNEKMDDSHEKMDGFPEKIDDSPEQENGSPAEINSSSEEVDGSNEKVDGSPEEVDGSLDKSTSKATDTGNVADISETSTLLSDRLSQSDQNKLGIEKQLDATDTQTTEAPLDQLKIEETNRIVDSNQPIKVSTISTAAPDLKEQSKKITDPKIELSHLTYTVLGLGDTNYTNFCNFGKNLDEILHQLGAHRFYPCGWADDGTGLEIVIEPWKEKFWHSIAEHVVKLTKQKQKHSTATAENETNVTNSGLLSEESIKRTSDKVMVFNDTKVVSEASCDIEERNTNDMIANLENLHLNDLELWRLNHPLLHLEFTLDAKLTLPKIPTLDTIVLDFCNETNPDDSSSCYQNGSFLPSAKSDICNYSVVEFRHLSSPMNNKPVKKVAEAVLQPVSDDEFDYEPGDSVAVLAYNHQRDVQVLLQRLAVPPETICRLSKSPSAKKQLPQHLPVCSSLKEIFTSCVDIRCIPKKALLLQLLSFCSDAHETRCLQELVSREGSEFYIKKILENRVTFIDLLFVFQSCRVKVAALLEVLPRLLPRAYSLTSSPLSKNKRLTFVYSVTIIPKSHGRFEERKGVCTGLFDSLDGRKSDDPATNVNLALYLRSNQSFRLPTDYTKPIVMIGPGTGVAPFIGFLRHRKNQLDLKMMDPSRVGESWLFFGCRFREADELFNEEIQEFVSSKILTNFFSCFSREHSLQSTVGDNYDKKYVQHLLRFHSRSVLSAIIEKDAVVYVCGDAANMAKDVYSTFSSLFTEYFGNEFEGSQYLSRMQKDKRYLQDVWT